MGWRRDDGGFPYTALASQWEQLRSDPTPDPAPQGHDHWYLPTYRRSGRPTTALASDNLKEKGKILQSTKCHKR